MSPAEPVYLSLFKATSVPPALHLDSHTSYLHRHPRPCQIAMQKYPHACVYAKSLDLMTGREGAVGMEGWGGKGKGKGDEGIHRGGWGGEAK